jgi:hypothetical protein
VEGDSFFFLGDRLATFPIKEGEVHTEQISY